MILLRYVPNNLTDQLQTLRLTIDAPAKEFLKKKFEDWYAYQISEQINPVALKTFHYESYSRAMADWFV